MQTQKIPTTIQRLADNSYLGRGNVISPLQFSGYIRPHCATECNGLTNPPGKLRAFDLAGFNRAPRWLAADLVESLGDVSSPLVLYVWRRARPYCKGGGFIFYGASVADEKGRVLARHIVRPRYFTNCDIVAFLESRAGLRSGGGA